MRESRGDLERPIEFAVQQSAPLLDETGDRFTNLEDEIFRLEMIFNGKVIFEKSSGTINLYMTSSRRVLINATSAK